MARVFISHAHSDESMARKLAALLGDALGLSPADFFLSSQQGHGVAPAANIRDSIVSELKNVPALVVLLTPHAAASPWVWLEAGNRLGSADKAPPIFLVPSTRFMPLVAPVADLRCLRLDDDGEMHELVQAVGRNLGTPVLDYLTYKPALDDLVRSCAQTYSVSAEKRARAVSWLKRYAVTLVLVAASLGILAYRFRPAGSQGEAVATADALTKFNDEMFKSAAKYLKLKGRVTTATGGVHGATVMVSRDEVEDPAKCEEPDCTKAITTTEGEFTIDLTKIKANNGDSVVLSVIRPGFAFFSKALEVDVRAMDQGTAPQSVVLAAAPPR
jgi:hypothetical protein